MNKLLACPVCKRSLKNLGKVLVCSMKHKYQYKKGVAVMAKLDEYQEIEAMAWEDEWKKGISKDALVAYKKNMKIFEKLGYWEESGEAAGFIPSERDYVVLDLGCGNGVSTSNIKGRKVFGLDLSEKQMIRAKARFDDCEFVVGDAQKLPFKANSFDLVVAINMLHHVGNPSGVIEEVYRVLKKGGIFLSVDPNLYNPIGFIGRGLYRLLNLEKLFPSFPQFALGEDEIQFSKRQYNRYFKMSSFKKYEVTPHRIERLMFFASILVPSIVNMPGYEKILIGVSRVGDALVKLPGVDNLCYFWKGRAVK